MAANNPDKTIVHCADTPNGKHFTVADIDSWHVERGFKRGVTARHARPELKAIGYHYVIYIDGSIHQGRETTELGAHCVGENAHSVGICMIGKDQFSPAQWASLRWLCADIGLPVFGHRDFESAKRQGKLCPGFDVATELGGGDGVAA